MKLTKRLLKEMVREEVGALLAKPGEDGLPMIAGEDEGEDEGEVLEEDPEKEDMRQYCASKGFYEVPKLLRLINQINQASKGDLNKDKP
ncbi:MAG TPA: hypothetical protein EYN66_16505 [Myxococcales bacterium]|nr:hypothetical protein [Myxococcales bacterium]